MCVLCSRNCSLSYIPFLTWPSRGFWDFVGPIQENLFSIYSAFGNYQKILPFLRKSSKKIYSSTAPSPSYGQLKIDKLSAFPMENCLKCISYGRARNIFFVRDSSRYLVSAFITPSWTCGIVLQRSYFSTSLPIDLNWLIYCKHFHQKKKLVCYFTKLKVKRL